MKTSEPRNASELDKLPADVDAQKRLQAESGRGLHAPLAAPLPHPQPRLGETVFSLARRKGSVILEADDHLAKQVNTWPSARYCRKNPPRALTRAVVDRTYWSNAYHHHPADVLAPRLLRAAL